MQLLKITSVPIKFKEQENIPADNNPDFSPEKTEVNSANVRIPVKNTSSSKNNPEMYDGHVVGTKGNGVQQKFLHREPDSMKHESASETEGSEYSVNYCYGKKNVKPEPKPTSAEYMRQNMQSAATIDSAMDSIDSVVPDKSWEPEAKAAVPKAVKIHAPKPQPHKVVEEYAHVEFEYLGGFNYVPKSSAPDYEEPEE